MFAPRQSPPVRRPDVSTPSATVNLVNGSVEDILNAYMHLTHGANYDDPAPWSPVPYQSRGDSR
ncbi:MAG: cyanobactin biosynthesis system PatB/AcyB/McaB family protein [Actinomycetes bacterium]